MLGACGGSDDEPASDGSAEAESECEEVPAAEPKQVKLKAPKQTVKAGEKLTATVETNCGSFDIALDTKGSPKTANSFAFLVRQGVYDGTPFHRVIDGFVIQGGDPAADGSGHIGYEVVEKVPAGTEYTKGVVAMAKTAADFDGTSGSQFFVVTAIDAALPPQYAVLGEVSNGFETVERIEALADPTLADEVLAPPTTPVVIESITLGS